MSEVACWRRRLSWKKNCTATITMAGLATRAVALLAELARHDAASVAISLTTLDRDLQRILEPAASPPERRLAAIETLAAAGIPVTALVAPVIPAITDHEIPAILEAAAAAGARTAGKVMLRLPHGVAPLFDAWLERHFPERRKKVLSQVRAMRNGKLYDGRYAVRQRGEGFHAEQTEAIFELARRRHGLAREGAELSTAAFRRPGAEQLGLL